MGLVIRILKCLVETIRDPEGISWARISWAFKQTGYTKEKRDDQHNCGI